MKKNIKNSKCVIVFSGGQDSTTCLFWAKKKFEYVEAVFFDYGQTHRIEMKSAKKISKLAGVKLTVLKINTFSQIGGSSLTDKKIRNPEGEAEGVPVSFVPGRNLIFLTFAAAFAYTKNIINIVTGVCQTDYSNYPDCRDITVKSLEKTLYLGMGKKFKIFAPLMYMTKAESVKFAVKYGALEAMRYSHTCYNGKRPPCGKCPACILRAKGFQQAGVKDPVLNN
ncbi:MAG TPA: 7-cyano-7-deazaguanine synthase QueC [bacterium]|nr:7-cyano-7-deazaguanine synthase QueC [bacterium]HPN30925.1 7-cyano-7-deazaguanine synthase QueC [bacterium]